VLALEVLSELFAVDVGPLVVERSVLSPVEVELRPVGLPGGYNRVDVHVSAVSMDGVEDVRLRQALALMVRNHLLDLLVAEIFVEGVDEAVEGPLLLFVVAGVARLR
jgi:hypothetical protein